MKTVRKRSRTNQVVLQITIVRLIAQITLIKYVIIYWMYLSVFFLLFYLSNKDVCEKIIVPSYSSIIALFFYCSTIQELHCNV